jgi:hypothetical protein
VGRIYDVLLNDNFDQINAVPFQRDEIVSSLPSPSSPRSHSGANEHCNLIPSTCEDALDIPLSSHNRQVS